MHVYARRECRKRVRCSFMPQVHVVQASMLRNGWYQGIFSTFAPYLLQR